MLDLAHELCMQGAQGWEVQAGPGSSNGLLCEDWCCSSRSLKLPDTNPACREHKAGRSEQDRAALEARFVKDIDQQVAALAKAAPNMKALEQFDLIKVSLCSEATHWSACPTSRSAAGSRAV